MSVMPEPLDLGSARKFILGNLVNHAKDFKIDPKGYPVAERMILGYPLPDWQRTLKWSVSQDIAFIESIWLGIPIGFYVVNKFDWLADGSPHPMSGLLLDGQQRFYALERYLEDEIPVFGHYWSELPVKDRRRFMNTPFPSYETSLEDDHQARDIYNRLNFGGTPHREDEKA
jgi:uncharacterized protein with ParB-like and HNH nuclease domain